jgi:hypothetical protein
MCHMNNSQVKHLIKTIVCEVLSMLPESHQSGEWWIDDSGQTIFADIDIGDSGHEGVVIQNLTHEILSHFGIEVDEPGYLNTYEDEIKQSLIDDGRFTEEDADVWERQGFPELLIKKLTEDKVYSTPEQTEDAVYLASGHSSKTRDARDYGMKYWRWKIMKASHSTINIQTWNLKPEDLGIIVRGIWDIMDDSDDEDKEVGEDGYPGPRVNVAVQASGRTFYDIPLAVLEKKMPSSLINYRRDNQWMKEQVNEDYHHLHKEYRLYEGHKKIVAIFEDNSKLFFEVHYHDNRGPDKEKWRRKAFTTWKSVANEIHGDVQLSEVGNPIQKTWKQSFKEALNHPKLQPYMRKAHHKKVFDDKGYPAQKSKESLLPLWTQLISLRWVK